MVQGFVGLRGQVAPGSFRLRNILICGHFGPGSFHSLVILALSHFGSCFLPQAI